MKTEKMWIHFSSNRLLTLKYDVFVAVGCRGILTNLFNIYEGVIDESVNTCCKLKFVFLEKRL